MSQWNEHEPIYLQVRNLVMEQIVSGALAEGEAVPSVRQVAGAERINPITVSKGYQMLVEEGLLEKRRGLGMFVTENARAKARQQERQKFLNDEWPRIIDRIRALDLDVQTLLTQQPDDPS